MSRYYGSRKSTVEDYPKTIPVSFLKKYNYFIDGGMRSGSIYWTTNDQPNGNIGLEISVSGTTGYLRVHFIQTDRDGEKKDFDYKIQLTATRCNYGGLRWWLICPCRGNRCTKLYLQNNGIFASRKTLGLSYESRNTSRYWRSLDVVFGRGSGEDQYQLRKSIKYPYRNGRPTRKMRKYLKMTYTPYSEREQCAMEMKLLLGKR